jgi:hypothetical protein
MVNAHGSSVLASDVSDVLRFDTFSHTAFWAFAVPFMIWVTMIVGLFGLFFALRAINAV